MDEIPVILARTPRVRRARVPRTHEALVVRHGQMVLRDDEDLLRDSIKLQLTHRAAILVNSDKGNAAENHNQRYDHQCLGQCKAFFPFVFHKTLLPFLMPNPLYCAQGPGLGVGLSITDRITIGLFNFTRVAPSFSIFRLLTVKIPFA